MLQHGLVPGGRSGAATFRDTAISFDAQLAERWKASEAAAAASASMSGLPTTSSALPASPKLSSSTGSEQEHQEPPPLLSVRGSPSSSFVDHEVYAIAKRLSTWRKFSAVYKTKLGPLVAEAVDDIHKSVLLDKLCHWAARHPGAVGVLAYPRKCVQATRLLSHTVSARCCSAAAAGPCCTAALLHCCTAALLALGLIIVL